MSESYTLQEVTRLLGNIAPKTLRAWMKDAGIRPVKDKRDPRKKLLSQQQLEQIATLHDRTLAPEKPAKPADDPLVALESRLTHQIETLRTDLERQIASLRAQTDEMAARIPALSRSEPQQTALPLQPIHQQPEPARAGGRAAPKPPPLAVDAFVRRHFPDAADHSQALQAAHTLLAAAQWRQPLGSHARANLIAAWRSLAGFQVCSDQGCPCQA